MHAGLSQLTGLSGLSVWPTSSCLVSELAAELLQRPSTAWRHLSIILPTRRLQTWLLALLSDAVPAFVPPRFFNLDEFVTKLAQALPPAALDSVVPGLSAALAKGPLEPLSEELLIAGLLRTGSYRHLRPGYEHEI